MTEVINAVPFGDLSLQWMQIRDRVLPDMEVLFQSSAFCLGPWVAQFEKSAANYLNVKHAIGVNSGTSALHLAAIVADIKAGDKVMLPAHTFAGTIWGVLYQGGIPILCDVDDETGTITVEELEKRHQTGVKAIIPVHLYGQPADMSAILSFAKSKKIVVIEDAAQAFGASYHGKKVCSLGDLGCVSFYPGKNLGAAGEGGLITTNDDAIADRLYSLRNHGQTQRYRHDEVGYNYRMEGFQALILNHKLPFLDSWTNQRKILAKRYQNSLQNLPLQLPFEKNSDHVWHLFVVKTKNRSVRDGLRNYLNEQGIETGLHYPIPMHHQPILSSYGFSHNDFPNAIRWAECGLTLPLFPGMTESQQDRVIEEIKVFFKKEIVISHYMG